MERALFQPATLGRSARPREFEPDFTRDVYKKMACQNCNFTID
jgi:hypothetical protein